MQQADGVVPLRAELIAVACHENMGDSLSLDDLGWRREPVGPDLDYEEIAALLDEVVRFRLLLSSEGEALQLAVDPKKLRTAMWEESLKHARQEWEDAIHRRFYYRGKPDEARKLDARAPHGGFSMWPKRRRRQQEIAHFWATSLAIDFDAWVEHVEDIAKKPIAGLHDELWDIFRTLRSLDFDAREISGYQRAEAEMINVMYVWREVGGVDPNVTFNDLLGTAILSKTASDSLSLDRLSELGAGAQRADIPVLMTRARGLET